MRPVRVFLGTACYRSVEPATMASRERFLYEARDAGDLDVVGSGHGDGYGATANAEILADGATDCGADLLVYHDSDIAFGLADVASLIERWRELGPKAIVAAMYPPGSGGDRLVGRLVGSPPSQDGLETTPRSFVEPLGEEAVEAEALGFGLVALPVDLLAELRRTRGYAFAEASQGKAKTTPDVEMCAAAKSLGYVLVADLRSRPMHLVREWRSL